jgi:hypothetical protein
LHGKGSQVTRSALRLLPLLLLRLLLRLLE